MMLANLLGLFWAWLRQLRRVETGEFQAAPSRVEFVLLATLSVLGVGILSFYRLSGGSLLDPRWLPVGIFASGAVLALLYVARIRWWAPPGKSAIASEVVMLGGMAVVCATIPAFEGVSRSSRLYSDADRVVLGEGQHGTDTHAITPGKLIWTFRAPDKGGISSSPLVEGNRVYVAAAHDSVFKSYGALYCLDRANGNSNWTFHDEKRMKPVFSSPCLADGKLYVGEGFHQDANCKLYCIRADNGEKVWDFQTGSHTESSPCVANG